MSVEPVALDAQFFCRLAHIEQPVRALVLMYVDPGACSIEIMALKQDQRVYSLRFQSSRRVRIEHPDLVRVRQQLLQPWDSKRSPNARPARHTSPTLGARRVPHNFFPGRF
jgi:hypothetical protein